MFELARADKDQDCEQGRPTIGRRAIHRQSSLGQCDLRGDCVLYSTEPSNVPQTEGLVWSAPTCPRFIRRFNAAAKQSGDKSPHSKIRHRETGPLFFSPIIGGKPRRPICQLEVYAVSQVFLFLLIDNR